MEPTPIDGAYRLRRQPFRDDRGFFARSFAVEEFQSLGLSTRIEQISSSFNRRAGTLRGLHRQAEPFSEVKLIRCTRGRVWDVIADPRRGSPSFGAWWATELSPEDDRLVYAAAGLLHGYVTLVDDSEVEYYISTPYVESASEGVRWDDRSLAIAWPRPPLVCSDRDRTLPTLAELVGHEEGVE
ncbi:MAG: dTDP-4-dehydrorhamnose 3,5-epimerase family protein [Acidimicrobiia bacterium]